MCASAHYERKTRSVFQQGSRAHLTLILEVGQTGGGGGGGGGIMAPPWDLGRGSRSRRENLHNGSVRCNPQNYIFRFSKKVLLFYVN